jgi:pimeloyl-ACP methyl ester carboxylesterase
MDSVTSTDGATITYERSGSGPPLVLVHGALSNGLVSWFAIRPLLEQKFTIYAMDRRGRRGTPETEGRSVEIEAQDVAAVVEAVGEPVFLLGHSYGGVCALGAATLAPRNVRKLIVYEPPLPTAMPDALLRALEDDAARNDWDAFVYRFLKDQIRVPQAELDGMRQTPFFQPLVEDAPAALADFRALSRYLFQPEMHASLAMPVLILVGGATQNPEAYMTEALASVLPAATVTELPGQAHIGHILDPANTADKITTFLLG